MKKRLLLVVLFVLFVVNGAIAGSGSLLGDWEGTARAILPEELPGDGTAIITGITLEGKQRRQEHSLIGTNHLEV